jgi:hypothetical protein
MLAIGMLSSGMVSEAIIRKHYIEEKSRIKTGLNQGQPWINRGNPGFSPPQNLYE